MGLVFMRITPFQIYITVHVFIFSKVIAMHQIMSPKKIYSSPNSNISCDLIWQWVIADIVKLRLGHTGVGWVCNPVPLISLLEENLDTDEEERLPYEDRDKD